MKLWGMDVGSLKRDAVTGAGSVEPPASFNRLSKRCRRLLEVACSRKQVVPKDGDSHFRSLVDWGLLSEDGTPTEAGRTLYAER